MMKQDRCPPYGDLHPLAKSVNAKDYKTIKNYIDAVKAGTKVSLRQCAIKAGFAESYASQAACRIGRMMTNNEAIRERMESEGIGVDALVKDIIKLSQAKLPPNKEDGIQYDDNEVQFKTLDLRAKIQDAFPTKRLEIDERKIVINIDAKDAQDVKAYLKQRAEST
jgi:hypothetical protein